MKKFDIKLGFFFVSPQRLTVACKLSACNNVTLKREETWSLRTSHCQEVKQGLSIKSEL